MQKNLSIPINIWLITLAFIVLSMIAVGGLTRLTESGLSMVDWRLIMGVIPPLNQTDWLLLFEDYKQYPEYQIKNLNMSLDEFKYIFYWEYGHRVLKIKLFGLKSNALLDEYGLHKDSYLSHFLPSTNLSVLESLPRRVI